jgi:hypothetical protein
VSSDPKLSEGDFSLASLSATLFTFEISQFEALVTDLFAFPPQKKKVANLKFKIPSTALLKENEIITTNLPWIH